MSISKRIAHRNSDIRYMVHPARHDPSQLLLRRAGEGHPIRHLSHLLLRNKVESLPSKDEQQRRKILEGRWFRPIMLILQQEADLDYPHHREESQRHAKNLVNHCRQHVGLRMTAPTRIDMSGPQLLLEEAAILHSESCTTHDESRYDVPSCVPS